jgi:signal transduction histidine kinase
MNRVPHYRYSLAILAAILVGSIALLAAANLWFLRRLQSESLHASAAQAVLELGSELARHLAGQPVVQARDEAPRRWEDFTRLVRSLRQVETSLQYVTVSEGDIILFHEDTSIRTPADPPPGTGTVLGVRIGRRLLATGKTVDPILTFTVQIPGPGTPSRFVQVAMRKEAVAQREERAADVLSLMFRLSVLTLAIAFGLAVLLVVWAFRHEMDRQRRRRDEEHLAFAGILADGIIHDVRNPMSSLKLDLQMLEKEVGRAGELRPGRLADLASRARKTIDRIDLVMKEFLYVSKPETGLREHVAINACIHDCLDLLGPRMEQANVHIRLNLDEPGMEVTGRSVALKRALINVLTNAKQASPSGGTVTVSTRREDGYAVVVIEDEGPGIPEPEKNRIFDMFVSGKPGGVGLGLYLAKAAVESNRGKITAENRVEGGARFVIRLPAGPPVAQGKTTS